MEHAAAILAVTGKGGVGKTAVSAAMVRILTEQYPGARVLAIDADPAVGLASALGVSVRETLDDIRKRVAGDVSGKLRSTEDVLSEARFRLLEAMEERQGFAFLAIGRPEAAGCYCAVNAYLRQVISLLIREFDYVVIDGEAGIEQINRRVLEKVTHLLFVSDQSQRGLQVISSIRQVADELVLYEKAGVLLNRVARPDRLCGGEIAGMPLLAAIGPDEAQAENDMEGRSVFALPPDSPLLLGVLHALQRLGILELE